MAVRAWWRGGRAATSDHLRCSASLTPSCWRAWRCPTSSCQRVLSARAAHRLSSLRTFVLACCSCTSAAPRGARAAALTQFASSARPRRSSGSTAGHIVNANAAARLRYERDELFGRRWELETDARPSVQASDHLRRGRHATGATAGATAARCRWRRPTTRGARRPRVISVSRATYERGAWSRSAEQFTREQACACGEEASVLKTSLATLSHELRTPLTASWATRAFATGRLPAREPPGAGHHRAQPLPRCRSSTSC